MRALALLSGLYLPYISPISPLYLVRALALLSGFARVPPRLLVEPLDLVRVRARVRVRVRARVRVRVGVRVRARRAARPG